MTSFQIILENDKPKFVVLPFGNKKAAEEYLDELWAEKAVADFNKSKPGKLYSLDEVKEKLGQKNQRSNAQQRSKAHSKTKVQKKNPKIIYGARD